MTLEGPEDQAVGLIVAEIRGEEIRAQGQIEYTGCLNGFYILMLLNF